MGTIAKALELLDLFRPGQAQIGLSEVARLSGVNKATCHRLLGDLCAHGLLEQIGAAREYRLGPGVLRLASLREAAVPMRSAAQPVLEHLAETSGETAHLSLLVAGRLKSIQHVYSGRHATRVMLGDTDDLPFHASASGLAVLAMLPTARQATVLAAPLPAITPRTETDPARLLARLQTARAEGHAESAGGIEADVHSLAVPLFGADGACAGAVAIAAPMARFTAATRPLIRAALMRAGLEITQAWGGVPPADLTAIWRAAA